MAMTEAPDLAGDAPAAPEGGRDRPLGSLVLARFRPDRPNGGAALRNWQNIRALGALGPVDVVTLGTETRAEPIEGVREWLPFPLATRSTAYKVLTRAWPILPRGHPTLESFRHRGFERWLASEGVRRGYDLVVIEELALAGYAPLFRRMGCRVIFDAHNVEGRLRMEMDVSDRLKRGRRHGLDGLRTRRLVEAERRVMALADTIWVCSATDADEAMATYPGIRRPTIVPNCVDVDAYRRPGVPGAGADWSQQPPTLVFPATYAYPPNEDTALRLAHEVLPAVRRSRNEARLVLVGREPTAAMRDAAGRGQGIEITGGVDSVLPYLEQPCVVTLPITLGSGTRLKILEAFAVGRPVVCSRKAIEGIEATDGEHAIIRDTPQDMAEAVLDLWADPALRRRLCENALALVRNGYSWQVAERRIRESLSCP